MKKGGVMPREKLVRDQWAELLKRSDIVGGNFYFYASGWCVGRIKEVTISGCWVNFVFDWSARKGKNGRWREREDNTASKQLCRILLPEVPGERIRSGPHMSIETKSWTTVQKRDLIPLRGKRVVAEEPPRLL